MSARTVAVTGAGGYVGHNLVRRLLDAGHIVRGIDVRRPVDADERAVWLSASVLDPVAIAAAVDGADIVYHLAAKITLAERDELAWRLNTEGVRIVADAALRSGVRRMVHASSMASFDLRACGGVLDETSPRALDPGLPVYGRSKLAGEQIFRDAIARGLDGVICYPTTLFGPWDAASSLSRINALLRQAARGRLPVATGGALDLVDVRDVAAGLDAAGTVGGTGEAYMLGGHSLALPELLDEVAQLAGRRGPRVILPLRALRAVSPLAVALGRSPENPLSRHALDSVEFSPIVDSAKAAAELGYSRRPTSQTLRDLVAFLRDAGALPPVSEREAAA